MSIELLISETLAWREEHKAHGRKIEMLACQIRLKALRDALAAKEDKP